MPLLHHIAPETLPAPFPLRHPKEVVWFRNCKACVGFGNGAGPAGMPSISASSSSVFGRLTGKRQTLTEEGSTAVNTNSTITTNNNVNGASLPTQAAVPSLDALSETDRKRLQNSHRRESSVLSLPSSVTDLGQSVRRSVSLRSHRTQHSTSSIGHRPRYPSSGNLITKTSPLASPVEASEATKSGEAPSQTAQQPLPRTRGNKLSISARSFSQRFRSTDNLSIFAAPDQLDGSTDTAPPVPALESARPSHSSMLAAQPVPRRPPPDRPNIAPQPSFARDLPPSHGAPNGAPSVVSAMPMGGAFNPSVIYQTIQETSAKRMATIEYMRKVHDGNIFYFSTLHYTPSSLSAIPSLMPHKLGRRATNYLLLGYSLPALLDMNSSSPQEYLKALSGLLHEFETYQNLAGTDSSSSTLSRARMGQMFKTGMGLNRSAMRTGRRASAATDSISIDATKAGLLGLPTYSSDATSPQDVPSPVNVSGHDFHFLMTPHIPFEPDFNTTFATLCDTLVDTYAKLLELISGPEVCSPSVGEAFAKADKAVRKILVSNVMREFEDNTRSNVRGEVAGLGKLVLGGLM